MSAPRKSFASDNTAGVAPEIFAALAAANHGSAPAYGADSWTANLEARFADVFETDVAVFGVTAGTAANALGLAALTPPWGGIVCHRHTHVNEHECGAPELFTGGAKLIPVDGRAGKLTVENVAAVLGAPGPGAEHRVVPSALSVTQTTELGALYAPAELAELAGLADRRSLRVQMDGARFANAVAALGCSPADVTWRVGVDVLAFGATKNGAMAAEAVVVFDRELATTLGYRRKRGGHLLSKMRFLSAQLLAYLDDDLWLRLARHANAMAGRLGAGLGAVPGVEIVHPIDSNMVWPRWPAVMVERIEAAGFDVEHWPDGDAVASRLVTSWQTEPGDVDALIAAAAG